MKLVLVAGAMLLATVCGCARLGGRSSGPYFTTKLCGLHVDSRTKEARLRLQLAVNRPLPRNGVVAVEFENPLDRAKPLLTQRTVEGSEKTLDLFSPPLEGARARGYEVVTRIYSAGMKNVLGIHTQICQSLFDERDVR